MLLKHEEKLTSIMNDIRDIKESGKTDNKVTRDKFNVLSQMLQEIEHKMDDMEERRNNARRETLKQQLFNLYYKYKERAEATGEMVLSQCEYEQFWTAFHEYESEPLNGDGLIHSVVEIKWGDLLRKTKAGQLGVQSSQLPVFLTGKFSC